MKLIVKIGLIVLLLMFNYQGVDADVVSSAIDRYATTTEHQDNMASDHGTLDTMSFTHSLLTGQQQVLAKLMPDDLRIRRAEELQQNFLKILIGRFSLRMASKNSLGFFVGMMKQFHNLMVNLCRSIITTV